MGGGLRVDARSGEVLPLGRCVLDDLLERQPRLGLVAHLENNKVQTRNYFAGNILLHPGYSHLDDAMKYPEANKVLNTVFFLGCSPVITDDMIDYIGQVVEDFKNA